MEIDNEEYTEEEEIKQTDMDKEEELQIIMAQIIMDLLYVSVSIFVNTN